MTGTKTSALLLALVCGLLLTYSTADDKYSSRYDNIDVDEVLSNPRLRKQYTDCILNTSPCTTGSARFLKEKFAEAYFTRCRKCTEKQVVFFDKVTEWFMRNDPDTWKRGLEVALKELRIKNGKK